MFLQTKIDGLVIIEPKIFEDNRGYFFENYNKKVFSENGIDAEFVQDNQSMSEFGTLRGIHLQTGEFSQAKLVRVLQGRVLDVVVDLRPKASTFGQWFSVELSAENKKQMFIPRGFGHGFSVLSETAVFSYKCDNFYNKESENGIIYNDSDLNIDWKIPADKVIISEKDLNLSTFSEYKKCI